MNNDSTNTFQSGPHDGNTWPDDRHPNLNHLIYLDVEFGIGSLGGWVELETASLVKSAPAMLDLLREIVAEYDQTHDGEVDSNGRARDWSAIPAELVERARKLTEGKPAPSTQVVSENKFCEHGNRIGDFCSGCEQQRMG